MKYIAIINGGFAFKSYEYKSEGIRIIRISDFNNDSFINKSIVRVKEDAKFEPYVINNNDILMCMTGGTVGKSLHVKQLTEKMYTNQRVADIKINLLLDSDYLYNYLISPYIKEIINISKNSTNDNISMDTINNFIIAIPPYAEQRRIIDKLDLINSLIIEYSGKYLKLRLLNDNYKENLKKSILQYAIQGKLVEQNDSDEPAPKLIERILDEKRKLMKEKKIKKENLSIIYKDSSDNQFYEKFDDGTIKNVTDEIPFVIPENWCWIRLKNLFLINPKNKLDDNDFYSFVPMNLISDGYSNSCTYEIKKWNNIKKGFTHFKDGDIGFAKITPCFQNRKSLIFQNLKNGYGAGTTELIVLRTILSEMNNKYLLYILKSSYFIDNGVKTYSGTAGQQRINKEFVKNFLIPIPPIIEQKIITEKLDNIFNYLETAE